MITNLTNMKLKKIFRQLSNIFVLVLFLGCNRSSNKDPEIDFYSFFSAFQNDIQKNYGHGINSFFSVDSMLLSKDEFASS